MSHEEHHHKFEQVEIVTIKVAYGISATALFVSLVFRLMEHNFTAKIERKSESHARLSMLDNVRANATAQPAGALSITAAVLITLVGTLNNMQAAFHNYDPNKNTHTHLTMCQIQGAVFTFCLVWVGGCFPAYYSYSVLDSLRRPFRIAERRQLERRFHCISWPLALVVCTAPFMYVATSRADGLSPYSGTDTGSIIACWTDGPLSALGFSVMVVGITLMNIFAGGTLVLLRKQQQLTVVRKNSLSRRFSSVVDGADEEGSLGETSSSVSAMQLASSISKSADSVITGGSLPLTGPLDSSRTSNTFAPGIGLRSTATSSTSSHALKFQLTRDLDRESGPRPTGSTANPMRQGGGAISSMPQSRSGAPTVSAMPQPRVSDSPEMRGIHSQVQQLRSTADSIHKVLVRKRLMIVLYDFTLLCFGLDDVPDRFDSEAAEHIFATAVGATLALFGLLFSRVFSPSPSRIRQMIWWIRSGETLSHRDLSSMQRGARAQTPDRSSTNDESIYRDVGVENDVNRESDW